jgi:hypothetical protein
MRDTVLTLLVAATVLLAGCSGGIQGTTPGSATDGPGDDTAVTGETATVNFYVSDQPMAIDNFESLNVTITKVGFHRVGDMDDADDMDVEAENETDGNETDDNETEENATDGVDIDEDAENATGANETDGVDIDENDGNATGAHETNAEDEEEIDEEAIEDDEAEAEAEEEGGSEEEKNESDDGDGNGEWVEHDVNNTTVDLTELRGPNATLVNSMDVPAGEYNKVFVYISDVEGTLADGTEVNVKLPSSKLHLNTGFTAQAGDSVDFVYDITVVKAGQSGKYLIQPVISESGTDQEINEVGDDDAAEDEDAEGMEAEGDEDEEHAGDEHAEGDEQDEEETEETEETETEETETEETESEAEPGPPENPGQGN